MNRKIQLTQALIGIISVVAVLIMICIWPLKLIQRSVTSKSNEILSAESKECNSEHMIAQVFVARGDELTSMDVYVCNDVASEDINLSIYDGTLSQVFTSTITVDSDQVTPGLVNIPVKYDVEKGDAYIVSVAGVTADLILGLEDHATTTNGDVYTISYDSEEDTEHNIIIRYNYKVEFSWWQVIVIFLAISVVAIAMSYIVKKLIKSRLGDKEVVLQRVFQYTLNPVIVIVTGLLMWLVFPGKVFSDKWINYLFWDAGILIAAAWALFEVNYKRDDAAPFISLDYIKDNYQGWLTAVALAHMLWYCFEYMNGLYDIHHEYAVRRILIWFLLTVISTFNQKEVCRWVNLIWLVIGAPLMYLYAKPYVGMPEEELTYKLNAYVIYIGVFVIINMVMSIISIIRKRITLPKINILFATVFSVMIIWGCIMANTRRWPGFLTLLVVILLFRLAVWDKREKWLEYLCNGIIINFLFMMVFSLLHRPYYGYMYHRYDMSYMTVTMTATHLTLCLAAVFAKLYVKSRECTDKRQMIPWFALFGLVANYELFTLSRTGYMSVIFMIALCLLLIVIVNVNKGQKLFSLCKYSLLLLVSMIVMFPATSTFTRIIPALYDDPVIYEYEPCIVTIYKGTPPDYEYYMDLPRFIGVFGSKILGVGDTITDAGDIYVPYGAYKNAIQYASASDISISEDELAELEEQKDVSNGRMDIYRSYISQLNLWGHNTMGATLNDGSIASHAHNVLLQVMYDHGIVYGIYYALAMLAILILAIVYYSKGLVTRYHMLIIALLLGFISAGIVEWIYHACNPFGLSVILSICSLFYKNESAVEENV